MLAASASAVAPEGSRLAFVRWSLRPSDLQLVTSDGSGLKVQPIAGGSERVRPLPLPFEVPSWSGDGGEIAFSGLVGSMRDLTYQRIRVFVVAADGSGLMEAPGTQGGLAPVMAPDGRTIAFARERRRHHRNRHGVETFTISSTSIWLVDLSSGSSRQLTPWEHGLNYFPSSFSPDGSTLAATRIAGTGKGAAVALRLDDGESTLIADRATGPVYSPDGSKIAFLRGHRRTIRQRGGTSTVNFTDLFVMSLDGTGLRQLTETPNAIESWPSWDPSGERLVYTRLGAGSVGATLGIGDSVMEINADGTCATNVLSSPHLGFYGAAWQPGPGREAGRIDCSG
jgi:Tol biopolymer transport system component